VILESLGFNNTYALALSRDVADQHNLKTISDLRKVPELKMAFSHEFLKRKDGWPGLAKTYGLKGRPAGIEHALAYQALAEGKIDLTDVYSTDGELKKYDLLVLRDNLTFFPRYLAVPLMRSSLSRKVGPILNKLAGTLNEIRMQELNAKVLEGISVEEVAYVFLEKSNLLKKRSGPGKESFWSTLIARTLRHLKLTVLALAAAMAVAIPGGILVYRIRKLSRPLLYVTGALQTIPAIALLAFMIPLFGIGQTPAIVALFLYSLLPILRNTVTALFSIDPLLKKVAVGMGLTSLQRLTVVELPLASPTILAGIKTAAIITIGTATLAAFIGAGGLGEFIVTGLYLNDTTLIMQGAIPAALLAILTELFFEGLEKLFIPKHLLQKPIE